MTDKLREAQATSNIFSLIHPTTGNRPHDLSHSITHTYEFLLTLRTTEGRELKMKLTRAKHLKPSRADFADARYRVAYWKFLTYALLLLLFHTSPNSLRTGVKGEDEIRANMTT